MARIHKRKTNAFQELETKVEDAKKWAKMALDDAHQTGNPNPSTEVHYLVSYLQELKEK